MLHQIGALVYLTGPVVSDDFVNPKKRTDFLGDGSRAIG